MPDWTVLRKTLLAEDQPSVLPPSVQLPMLPRALTEFTKQAQDPEADPRELSRIISTDSGLSSELLRHVNSCAIGAKYQITSVQQALTLLGIRTTLLHLTTTGLKQAMKSTSSKLINFQNFWNTNLERALFSREIAKLLKADVDLAFTAGMLQDFLLPLITNQEFQVYLEFTENRDQFQNLPAFEMQKFGWDHAQAAGQVLQAWHLPDELVCCVCLHHRGLELLDDEQLKQSSAAAVAVSSLLPDALRQEPDGVERLLTLESKWEGFKLLSMAERMDEEFRAMAGDVRNHFSFLRICQKTVERLNAKS